MGGNERNFVSEAFDTNWIAPLGPNVNGFENDLETYLGENTHVAALSSGTGAIHLALTLLGVSQGDEVLCQSFTFAASSNPISYVGATTIFIDSEKETWNMCPILLEEAINERLKIGKKPKAIIVVDLYGMPCKINEINEISIKYSIPIIEDSAEALGSSVNGINCGLFGVFGILSFNGNKIITTSGGGALVCKTKEEKDKTVFLATQARDTAVHYQHSEIGFNYRMSNVVAGIGRGQMEVLNKWVSNRRNNFNVYKETLGSGLGLSFLEEPEGFFSNRWLSTVLTPSFEVREKIRLALEVNNIESRPLWKPMHLQPVHHDTVRFENGTSEDLFNRGLCLPSGSNLESDDLERIIEIILKTVKND